MQMMHGTVCALMQYTGIYICFEFEEKEHFNFANYEGFDKSMYGTCGVQYLQQG